MPGDIQDEQFCSKTSCLQICYGLWANLHIVIVGTTFGFSAVSIPQLMKDPLLNPSLSEQGWIASVLTLAAPFGCFLSGYFMDKYGRRTALILCEAPIAAGYLYIGLAQSTTNIIIGRFINGFGVGMALTPPRVFSTEISLPKMRGILAGAFPNFCMGVGLTIEATLGSFVSWRMLCYLSCGFCVFLHIINWFIPETPYYLLMKGDLDKAKKNLRKFRSQGYDIDSEMENMIAFKQRNDIHKIEGMELLRALSKRNAMWPFCIVLTYLFCMQMSGVAVMTFYMIEILKDSHSTFNVHAGNVINQIMRAISAIVVSVLLYLTGRRTLGIISAILSGLSMLAFGFHVTFDSYPEFWPQVYSSLFSVFCIGYHTVPFLVMSEMYPLQVRGLLGGITLAIQNIFLFGANKAFPHLKEWIGLNYTFIMYGISSTLCSIFLFFFLPETKGLTLQQIEELFNKRAISSLTRTERSSPDLQRRTFKDRFKSVLDFSKRTRRGERL